MISKQIRSGKVIKCLPRSFICLSGKKSVRRELQFFIYRQTMYNINGYSNYTAVSIPKQSTKRWKSIILFEICAIRWIQCVQREAATHMKKCTAIILAVVLALTAVGCSQNGELGEQLHSASLLTLGELTEIGIERKLAIKFRNGYLRLIGINLSMLYLHQI